MYKTTGTYVGGKAGADTVQLLRDCAERSQFGSDDGRRTLCATDSHEEGFHDTGLIAGRAVEKTGAEDEDILVPESGEPVLGQAFRPSYHHQSIRIVQEAIVGLLGVEEH